MTSSPLKPHALCYNQVIKSLHTKKEVHFYSPTSAQSQLLPQVLSVDCQVLSSLLARKIETLDSGHDSELRYVVFLYSQTFGHVYFHTFELIWTNIRQCKSELFRISTRLSFVLLCIVYGVEIVYSSLSMVPKFLHVSS